MSQQIPMVGWQKRREIRAVLSAHDAISTVDPTWEGVEAILSEARATIIDPDRPGSLDPRLRVSTAEAAATWIALATAVDNVQHPGSIGTDRMAASRYNKRHRTSLKLRSCAAKLLGPAVRFMAQNTKE